MKLLINTFIKLHVMLYRLSGGRFGGAMGGNEILLLNTIGRKSGKPRTTPLMFQREGNDYIVAASNAGGPKHPGWYYNLRNEPNIEIEVGGEKISVVAEQADSAERERLFNMFATKMPQFADYAKKTTREIQMFRLVPQ